jgi:sec-independent protein translocase protein TatA
MLGSFGPMELIIVAVIALVVLGPRRLPDAGRSLGRGMREFRSAISGGEDDERDAPARDGLPQEAPERRAGG